MTQETWLTRFRRMPTERIRELVAEDPAGYEPAAWDALQQVAMERSLAEASIRADATAAAARTTESTLDPAVRSAAQQAPAVQRRDWGTLLVGVLIAGAPLPLSIAQGVSTAGTFMSWGFVLAGSLLGALARTTQQRARHGLVTTGQSVVGAMIGGGVTAFLARMAFQREFMLGWILVAFGVGLAVAELRQDQRPPPRTRST